MSVEHIHRPTMYPERPGIGIESQLDMLEKRPEIELTPEEKEAALQIERILTVSTDLNRERFPDGMGEYSMFQTGEEQVAGIERVWEIPVESRKFFTDYFLTDEGYQDLKSSLGYTKARDQNSIEKFLATASYFSKKIEDVDAVVARSREYAINQMVDQFAERGNNFEEPAKVQNPSTLSVIVNPEDLVKKLKGFTQLKNYLKQFTDTFANDDATSFEQAVQVVAQMHTRRLNELIAELYPKVAGFIEQAIVSDSDKYQDQLDQLRETLQSHRYDMLVHIAHARSGITAKNYTRKDVGDRLFERLDKFVNGVGVMRDHEYTVISEQAKQLSQEDETVSADTPQNSLFGGIDSSKLQTVTINASTMQSWAKRVLGEYGILSEEGEQSYTASRPGRAKDGKWQVIIDPKVKVLSVNSRKGIMTIPQKFNRGIASQNPTGAVAVLDHEIRHVLQHENKQKFGLALTNKVGMDRASIYKEAGAIAWEAETQAKLFGLPRETNAHYLKAVQARYQGGTLSQCAKAFFDSHIKQNPDADKRAAMELAVDRSMRIFRNGGVYKSANHHVSNSGPLVYLEQEVLARKLRGTPAAKLLSIADVNIEMLAQLHRVGLVDVRDVHAPELKPSDIILPEVKQLLEDRLKVQ